MKLSLANLAPLKEIEFDSPAPEGMDIPNFDSLVDALKWKNDLENYSMDLENELKHAQRQLDDKLSGQGERGAEPEGGPIQQKIAGELDQIKSNIQTFKKELNTISSKIDYFDQNYLGEGDYADRLANSGTDSDGRNTWGDKTGYSDEEMAQGKGKLKKYPDKDGRNVWGDKTEGLNETTEDAWKAIDVSRKAEKELNKELNGNKQWQERTAKKLAMLKKLNDDGKFKKKGGWDEEALQGWVDKDYSWETVSGKFANNLKEMKKNNNKNLITERLQELAGIKPLYQEAMQQGDYSAIEKGWDGLDEDEQRDIINTALSGEARPDDFEKDFDQLKSEIPDFESGVANYLGIDEGEDLTFEPEDMDNPDEDLVIIGSGYADIENKFGERPSQTNGEYAKIGQWVVDNLETITKGEENNGDKEAALDYIYGEINEGSCGYSQDAPGGEELDTPGGTQGMDADERTRGMLKIFIQKEIAKLKNPDKADLNKDGKLSSYEKARGAAIEKNMKEGEPGDFDRDLEYLMGKDDFAKATSNEVPGLGDTVIDDKTDITTSKKTFMQMMMQFTDEPFLIETGLKLYDAWANGEGGLKPSRILDILKQSSN